MKEIEIIWLSDSWDCETCGGSYADGATVHLNGELIVDMRPSAHCYDSVHYEPSDVLMATIKALGYEVKEENY